MYNVRSKQQSVKNKKNQDIHSFKSYKLFCSCSANSKFKRNQSENRFNAKSEPWIQTNKDSEKFLREELKRYGLDSKKIADSKFKHHNSPEHEKSCCLNVKNSPQKNGAVQKENIDQTKLKSKTDSNLAYESYVDDLKKEIKSQREDIPSLPKKYKQKYLNSIKEELLLNKVACEHDDNRKVKELIREIQVYRATKGSPYLDSMKSTMIKPKMIQPIECSKDPDRCRRNNCKVSSENSSVKGGKGRKMKKRSPSRYKSKGRKDPASTSKPHDSDPPTEHPANNETPIPAPLPKVEVKPPILEGKSAATSTQGEIELAKENSKTRMEPNIIKRLDVIDELIPILSSVIETSEKNLKKTFEEAFQSTKVLQERGVSPVEELTKLSQVEDENLVKTKESASEKQTTSQTHTTEEPQETLPKVNEQEIPKPPCQENLQNPFIGDLLVNIENIRQSRCLLEGFQKELSQIKKDINECIECNFHQKPQEKTIQIEEKYCEKHGMYIPLFKMKYLCSKSDQIRIFNALKTEIALKKELENQLQKISKLERELSKVKMSQNEEEIKTIEAALQFTKSYFNNLLVKQETERLLNEQQKILKQDSAHRCRDTKKCDKCSVEIQIHEILGKVRESINKDLVEARQRLKIQKMPSINIKKPLQIQNTLRLNIPPTSPPQELLTKNVACETVFEGGGNEKSFVDREIQTRIYVNKTTSIESQRGKILPEQSKNDTSPKQRSSEQEGIRILKFLDKSSFCVERTERKKKTVNERPQRCLNKAHCCQFLKAQDSLREGSFEISRKTPSELGFRCTVGTQCDSETSLNEFGTTNSTKTTENQAVGMENSSNYLFGFKEYLRHKSVDCSSVPRGPNKVDVVLQVNLDGNIDTDVGSKSRSVQSDITIDAPLTIAKIKNLYQNKDEEVTKQTLPEPKASEANSMSVGSASKRLNERIKSYQRKASIKKMFFPTNSTDATQGVQTMNNTMQNENIEPKYKMKSISQKSSRQESDNEEIETGDIFYKSLIGETEMPERKTIISLDTQLQRLHSSSTSDHTLRTLSSVREESGEGSLVHPVTLEQMSEDVQEEQFYQVEEQNMEEEQYMEEEQNMEEDHNPADQLESNESEGDDNLSIDYDLMTEKKEQYFIEERKNTKASTESENREEKANALSYKSSHEAQNEEKLSTNYGFGDLNVAAETGYDEPSTAIMEYENEDSELVSKENTQILENIITKIMNDAENTPSSEPEETAENEEEYMSRKLEENFDADYKLEHDGKLDESPDVDESRNETVLSLFSPNYTLRINKRSKDIKGHNSLENDILLDCPIFLKSSKMFGNYKSLHRSLELSDDTTHIEERPSERTEHLKQHETKTLNYINQFITDEYKCLEEPCEIASFDSSPKKTERISIDYPNPTCGKDRLAGLKKIAQERLEYSRKCSKEEKSLDSSIVSSEGEVKCKCHHVSTGEFHHCPYEKRIRLMGTHPGIHYKNKLSSHIVLENERKHYNHWVTYYSNKKKKEDSSSSKETKD